MKRFLIFIIALVLVPTTVWGASTLRAGEVVSVESEQTVEEDFYSMGETVVMSGDIKGDMVTIASKLKFDGQIAEDLLALAWAGDINGLVSDDVRIVAGEVSVDAEITGDLVVIARSLRVSADTKIGGDILFFGNTADIEGTVDGSVLGYNDSLRIDGTILSGVDVTTSDIVLGDKAKIEGDIKYVSFTELKRAQNAQVEGKIIRNDPVLTEENKFNDSLILFLIALFATLVIYLLFRPLVQRTARYTSDHTFRSFLVGFGVIFLIPIASFILLISTLGSLLAFVLIFVYLALLLSAFIISGVVAGSYLRLLFDKSREVSIGFVVLGSLAVHMLVFLPVIGIFVFIGLFTLTLGSLSINIYRLLRG